MSDGGSRNEAISRETEKNKDISSTDGCKVGLAAALPFSKESLMTRIWTFALYKPPTGSVGVTRSRSPGCFCLPVPLQQPEGRRQPAPPQTGADAALQLQHTPAPLVSLSGNDLFCFCLSREIFLVFMTSGDTGCDAPDRSCHFEK